MFVYNNISLDNHTKTYGNAACSSTIDKLISDSFSAVQSAKIHQFAHKILAHNNNTDPYEIGRKIITKFKGHSELHKELLHFDLQLARLKKSDQRTPLLATNVERLKKWKDYGFDPNVFYLNGNFVDFIFDSFLGSQMKVTRCPQLQLREVDGQPALLVQGQWMSAKTFLTQFESRWDKTYREKFIFKKGTDHVFTYTDTGCGLVPFHPYREGLKTPISKLTKEEYHAVLHSAQRFQRQGESTTDATSNQKQTERRCILQIVSSRVNEEKKYSPLTKNLHNLLNRKHPWIRIIAPDELGDGAQVYSIGFNWQARVKKRQPLHTSLGRFRSIDFWEYQAAERYVTNIAITSQEFKRLQEFPEKFLREGQAPAFNLFAQNCSVGVREAVADATGIELPTGIATYPLLRRLLPDFVSRFLHKTERLFESAKSLIARVTPRLVHRAYDFVADKIVAFYSATVAFRLSFFSLFLGAARTANGRQLSNAEQKLAPGVCHLPYWYDLSLHRFHLPALLQEWQEQQPSTVIYPKGYQRYSIIPPSPSAQPRFQG